MHEGLIVGIDAGMTNAYAILNLDANLTAGPCLTNSWKMK